MDDKSHWLKKDETRINVISISKAYRHLKDVERANVTLYDSQLMQMSNRVEFQENPLKTKGHYLYFRVKLIAPDGTVQKRELPEDAPVFFLTPALISWSNDVMDKDHEVTSALVRLVMNTDVLWSFMAGKRLEDLRSLSDGDPSIASETEIVQDIAQEAKKRADIETHLQEIHGLTMRPRKGSKS